MYTALATGAAISAPLLSSLLSGCSVKKADSATNFVPKFFSDYEFATIKEVIDLILPKTDSPSATEVGVHKIIDTMVSEVYADLDRRSYRNGLESLLGFLKKDSNKLTLLQSLESPKNLDIEVKEAYLNLKQQ